MKKLLLIASMVALLLTGCASMFACTTDASYIIRVDGSKEVHYSSCKEQQGLDARFGDVRVKVANSSTQEEVIAAVLSMQTQMMGMIKELAAKGAGS
jgi:starvation-inducible outer membrane lipoprotein